MNRTRMAKIVTVAVIGGVGGLLAVFVPPATARTTEQVQPDPGRALYLQDCAWCHGAAGEGTEYGTTLRGVGAASADFMLSTGRMPIPEPINNPPARPVTYSAEQIAALVAVVESFGDGPPIPRVDPARGDDRLGLRLYQENCAACHGAAGSGGAMTQGLIAPSVLESTPREIAEAMRLGGAGLFTGNMPRFDPEAFDDHDVNSIIAYIERLPREDRGGASLGRTGPVAEGFVAWAVGLLALILVIRWIGGRE
ncbi:MAG TPA: c-type cytochrome [Actinomycetota bacterium]|nr:c-type cytochrome [Actinomycetota bacterium]